MKTLTDTNTAKDTRTTKVRIALTVEVPVEEWAATYGCGNSVAEVREDVKAHAADAIQNGGQVHTPVVG